MLDVRNVYPLDHFKRQTAEFRARLKATGQPEVLTVDGRAELIVQDAVAYQELVRELEQLRQSRVDDLRQKVWVGFSQAGSGDVVDGEQAATEIRKQIEQRAAAKARRARRK